MAENGSMPMTGKRVAVIGAGPSGLSQLHAFQTAAAKGTPIPEVVCFEKQSNWGGLWNYSWRTGLDEYGESCHGSMYRHLWSNAPKEGLEYADYTFEEHYGQVLPSYLPRALLMDYLEGRSDKSGIRKWIRFNTPVRMVSYSDESEKFTVTVHNHQEDKDYSEEFDHVIVATGHFSVPNMPDFDGIDDFAGRVLHSHDFRDAQQFKGQDILIVGRSYSAEDIGSQCYKYGAKSITISYRSAPTGIQWPENWKEVPLLQRIDNKTCHFKDGSSKEIDSIIMCTGYIHHFPFLPEDLRLRATNRLWVLGLYRGIVWQENPRLMYLGMQDQYFTFNMFDAQAWYARDVVLGRIKLPSKKEMEADSQRMQDQENKLKDDSQGCQFQADYVKELMAETDCPTVDTDAIVRMFAEWVQYRADGIMTYRDHSHRSLKTGKMASKHPTTWLDAMDDSIEVDILAQKCQPHQRSETIPTDNGSSCSRPAVNGNDGLNSHSDQ